MSGFWLVAGVIGTFFIAGIGTGVLLVAALPRFRRRNHLRYVNAGDWLRYVDAGHWPGTPSPGEEDEILPRWPGE